MLRVNPEVAKVLKANSARLLTEMEELTKKTVIIKSDPALHQEQFDIN
jgi:ribonuclease G